MFRLAPVVLLAASLGSVATAQAADQAVQKNPIKLAPTDGTVNDPQPAKGDQATADGTVLLAPSDYGPEPKGTASLKMSFHGIMVEANVHSSEPGFVGVVGLSLTPDLIYPFGMMPLLADAVVMAFGATDTQYLGLRAPLSSLPSESITLFGQALVIDEKGFWSSNVVGLTIGGKNDGTEPAPANGSPINAGQAAIPAAH
ncbi:MAG TPA: hypothetical protein VFD82_04875 [Planctomycetota bacterium]|nr:hypothetical protein [Planctomycetota bacterium]